MVVNVFHVGVGGDTGRCRVAAAAVALVAVLVFGGMRPRAAAAGTCERETVVNYRAPLEALPHVRQAPRDERLTLGQIQVRVAKTGYELPTGASTQGFRLAFRTESVTPRWELDAELRRVSVAFPKGHLLATRHLTTKRVHGERPEELTFPIASRPAIYRITMTIADARGRRLGRFGRYVRVLPFGLSPTLRLLGGPYRPGEWVDGCLENRGVVALRFDSTWVERLEGSEWRPVVLAPQYRIAVSGVGETLLPGNAELTSGYLPPNAGPGTYRLAWTGSPFSLGEGSSRWIDSLPPVELSSASFEVAGP